MREIAGIFTHKEALELLGLAPPDQDTAADAALREAVIEAANRSKEVQSQLTKDAAKAGHRRPAGGRPAPEADERPLRASGRCWARRRRSSTCGWTSRPSS
ncbi:MAG: hypothetical protein H6746_01655 [Deltaproteobacteria bacterium]|nr:hypothetical protein [Deltaproteobacteria bacterium]